MAIETIEYELLKLHDQEGFDLDLSLQMCSDNNIEICLLFLLLAFCKFSWSKKRSKPYCIQYSKLFRPTIIEQKALDCILGK